MKLVRVMAAGLGVLGVAITVLALRQASGQQPDKGTVIGNYYPGNPSPLLSVSPPGFPGFPGRSHDPEMDKLRTEEVRLEREVAAAVRAYAQAKEDEQRTKIKEKLSERLEKQFDLQQKRRKLEVERIEAELKKLRDLMQKRTDARKTIVEKRLDQLVREAEGLGWTPPAGPAPRLTTGYEVPPGARP